MKPALKSTSSAQPGSGLEKIPPDFLYEDGGKAELVLTCGKPIA
jgi:hypothetical protein